MTTTLSKERLHGTLDALVLKTLSAGPLHGYAVARWLEEATGDAIQVDDVISIRQLVKKGTDKAIDTVRPLIDHINPV